METVRFLYRSNEFYFWEYTFHSTVDKNKMLIKSKVVFTAVTKAATIKSKKISKDQELIQSDPTSCPQNQKGNNLIHKLTAVYERHSR